METLFPDGENLDVQAFERLAYLSTNNTAEQEEANLLINEFKNMDKSWLNVTKILEQSKSPHAKFVMLHIFIDGVKKKWESLNEEEQSYFRQYFFDLTIDLVNQDCEPFIVSQANRCLVEILKNEWPAAWPSFIRDYMNASKKTPQSCVNCLKVLAELSDDAIDSTTLTSDRTYELQAALSHDVGLVIAHAEEILQAGNEEASTQALTTLSHFLRWLEISEVLSSDIVPAALAMIQNPDLRDPALSCLQAIAEHPDSVASNDFSDLFDQVVGALNEVINFEESTNNFKLAETVAAFLTLDGCCLLQGEMLGAPTLAVQWILELSKSEDTKRVCVDCIADLTRYFFMQKSSVQPIPSLLITMFSEMVDQMEQPPDYPPRELQEASQQIHESMRAALNYLAKLVKDYCASLLLEKLKSAENPHELLRVCWSIAAVSGAFIPPVEDSLIRNCLQYLSDLLENGQGGAEIACAYVYLCSNYTRYLYNNIEQLGFIVHRALSFCGEEHQELQDVSVSCLNRVAETCYSLLIKPFKPGQPAFVEELVESSNSLCMSLDPSLVPTFYQAAATLITHTEDSIKQQMISRLLVPPVAAWEAACKNDIDISQVLTPIAVFSKVILISDTAFYPEVEGVIAKAIELLNSLIGNPDKNSVVVREGILGLVESFFKVHADAQCVPSLVEVVINDFLNSPDTLKLPIDLDCFTTLIGQIIEFNKNDPNNQLNIPFDPEFVENVVLATKDLISGESPEIIASYAKLLGKLLQIEFVRSCGLFEELLVLLVECIKRPEEMISISGLDGLLDLLDDCSHTLSDEDGFGKAVHTNFGKFLLQEMMSVALDSAHVPLFNLSTKVLINIITSATDAEQMSNYISERVREDFKHVSEENANNFGQIMTQTASVPADFRTAIKNFIISSRKTSSKARAIYAQVEDEVLGNDSIADTTDPLDLPEF
ncbi:hypothetical protein TVAG_376080 [Trichomonas vaginalis G3]|uniref:Importin N-terminal domain-containing protein n=1 Tax=Trichomonas vaginalis (strain ATCC PRA-98 / G3) TaxID=412133 RepID=A2FNV7_TRIV3|nr:nuclear export signal receptor protein [Trichomonas vaginalis G3]EAX93410.1 hypothetical protein TVAG_376080 [Trichomonas vaginalis G3]KAI5531191.1 nuclear export signal receptor protein [Trichomonas vaginalis G3]|eukprot:XP_001306340.1 hypothetical protein [Trichomonas vaginalis G3]